MFKSLPDMSFSELEIERCIHQNDAFLRQYPALLRLGERVENETDLTGLALAVYGWMPTILRSSEVFAFPQVLLRSFGLGEARNFIEKLSSNSLVNASWVGTSKFLHALNPSVFPIWDSHIARAFGLYNRPAYERRGVYLDYFDFCHAALLPNEAVLTETAERIETQFHYRPTALRCLEFLIFSRSKARMSAQT